jgi:SAM-dependent methyltransferase
LDWPPYYRQFYDQAWIDHETVGAEARVPVTIDMISGDVSSVLDVGCGDGTILEAIKGGALKVGIDISRRALSRVKAPNRVLGSAEALPFHGPIFDLVILTEVLEHLPDVLFQATLNEIQQVAKKYILVSVPFREDLQQRQTLCSRCGHVYHIHLHLRSFDLGSLGVLFPLFCFCRYRFSGPPEKTMPRWLLKIRRRYGQRWEWDKDALCPCCGNRSSTPPKRSAISVTTSLLAHLYGETYPKWVSALFVRS